MAAGCVGAGEMTGGHPRLLGLELASGEREGGRERGRKGGREGEKEGERGGNR